jgi:hypothetical protein
VGRTQPLNLVTVPHKDLSRGIDARSLESNLADGYSEDLLNADTNGQGHLLKRPGYQGYAGYVPLRVKKIDYRTGSVRNIDLTFDGSVNVGSIPRTPIVVQGKTSASHSAGDFTNVNSVHWYPNFFPAQPFTFPAGVNQNFVVTGISHGFATDNLWVDLFKATSTVDLSNEFVFVNSISINESTFDVTINYTSPVDLDMYVLIVDKTPVGGQIYQHVDVLSNSPTPQTFSFNAATHGLSNFNIIPKFFIDNGVTLEEILPDSFTLDVAGTATVTVTNKVLGNSLVTYLEAAPVFNTQPATVDPFSTSAIVSDQTTSAFSDMVVYSVDLVSGLKSQIVPDSIAYDDSSKIITVTATNSTASPVSLDLIFKEESLTISSLTVTGSPVLTPYTDAFPQLTVWGINQELLYRSSQRGGYVSHIDTYRNQLVDQVVCGLGGNEFVAKMWQDVNVDYMLPLLYPLLNNRVLGSTVVGPTFWLTGSTPARTRGYITADNVDGSHQLQIISAIYNSSTGWVDFGVQATNKAVLDSTGNPTSLSSAVSTLDKFTVSGMQWLANEGTFEVKSVSDVGSNTFTLSALVANRSDSDFDEVSSAGFVGMGTDVVNLTSANTFLVGDLLSSDVLSTTVDQIYPTYIVISGLNAAWNLPSGLELLATRTGNTFPMRDVNGVPTVVGAVVGDMVVADSYKQQLRIVGIDTVNNTLTFDEAITLADMADNTTFVYVAARWIPIEAPTSQWNLPQTTYFNYFPTNNYDNQPTIRSVGSANSLYFTNYDDEVKKYDGNSLYNAGLFRWQPGLFAEIDDTVGSIVPDQNPMSYSAKDPLKFTVESNVGYSAGMYIHDQDPSNDAIYEIKGTSVDPTTGDNFIYTVEPIVGTGAFSIALAGVYRYYFRLNAIDVNGNVTASATTSNDDFVIKLPKAAQIKLRLVGMPTFGAYDYDRIQLKIFRTTAGTTAPFYLVQTLDVPFEAGLGYIDFVDGRDDSLLTELDDVNTALLGAEIGTGWSEPVRCKYITSLEGRLILGNIKNYPDLDIQLRSPTGNAMLAADFVTSGSSKWLFKKDSSDVGTVTDMVNRVNYQMVGTGGAISISGISNTSSTFTITATNTLSVGNWVYLYHSTVALKNSLTYAGWWQVSSATSGNFTVKAGMNVAAGAHEVDSFVVATDPKDVPVLIGLDGNYSMDNGNVSDPSTDPYEFVAMRRLANAMNCSMVVTDRTVVPGFLPWLVANAGNEFSAGELVVRQHTVFSTFLEVTLDSSIGSLFDVFVNDLKRDASEQVSAQEALFPSRILISFKNYPEIFDSPTAILDTDSLSAIDVNPDDGQEITGIIPFFSTSAFKASQTEGVLVVFKSNSIYLISIDNKFVQGQQIIQKLDSRGLGCTAPKSIANTDKGIIFANNSGIFRLNRDLSILFVGRFIDRIWQNNVNRNSLDEMVGHHYAFGQKYKLSVPYGTAVKNSVVLVYDHTRELYDKYVGGLGYGSKYDNLLGAWTRYDNHAATGWANLNADAFFGTTGGQVYSIRNTGEVSDFRDDTEAINMEVIYKALDFGDPSRRKLCYGIVTHVKVLTDTLGLTLYSSTDMHNQWEFVGAVPTPTKTDRKILSLRSTIPNRRFLWLQVKYVDNVKDEPVQLAEIDFVVAGLSYRGVTSAAEVTSE